jgi:O-acetyl-ADP-ribose deacetylase (regulator of RNase III)
VAVWKKGDITRLQIDVILVNAANDQEGGLGCFVPDHRCIDNVIHRGAGPRLRQACHEAMLAYRGGGYLLSGAGTPPIVTPAFFLPSNHVIHITGPHIRSGRSPTDVERHLLAKAYWGSLNKAAFLRVVLLLRTEE